MSKDYSHPVFPEQGVTSGISVRDYFAAHALMGLIGAYKAEKPSIAIAGLAYRFADAMLEERKA